MTKKESIDERLDNILKHWDKVLSNAGIQRDETLNDEKMIQHLMNYFGLTVKEAKAWLEQEPNFFTSRRIFTDKPDRRRRYRIVSTFI